VGFWQETSPSSGLQFPDMALLYSLCRQPRPRKGHAPAHTSVRFVEEAQPIGPLMPLTTPP
ncbi:hypothetical protein P7K49_015248, partial [Saguinus oedipus]